MVDMGTAYLVMVVDSKAEASDGHGVSVDDLGERQLKAFLGFAGM